VQTKPTVNLDDPDKLDIIVLYIGKLIRQQELSYRKQIARQLRTQYFNGICKPNYPMTLSE